MGDFLGRARQVKATKCPPMLALGTSMRTQMRSLYAKFQLTCLKT